MIVVTFPRFDETFQFWIIVQFRIIEKNGFRLARVPKLLDQSAGRGAIMRSSNNGRFKRRQA